MKYSVIIPCFNTAFTLKETVEGIKQSGLKDFEIILIDDGSKDITPLLCDEIAGAQDNIRVIHQENGGVSSARNRGIEDAKGEYIWFFDSDDFVEAGSMAKVVQIIDEYAPDILMFGMSFDYYNGKRMYQRLELYYDKERYMFLDDLDEVFSDLYHNNMLTPCWNKLFLRTLLLEKDIRFHKDMFVMEDFLFSLEALKHCRTIYTFPHVIYRYHQSSGIINKTAARRADRILNLTDYLKPFEPLLENHPEIMTSLFCTLLRQKISVQLPKEMYITAKTINTSPYVTGTFSKYCSGSNKELVEELRNGQFWKIYYHFRKKELRQMIVFIIKQFSVYSLFKGSRTRRGVW